MPPPTAHTPSGADLRGPVIVPVILVTVPLSNNGAKTAAKPSGTCPITRVELHLYCRSAMRVVGFSLSSRSTSSINMVAFHTGASQTG